MHNGEDMGESNHSRVMQAFESCGFAVCLQQVCPSNCGIPMTRQRVHYMGLRMAAVPDAKAQVSRMADVWSAILAGQFKQYKLEDFLDDSSAGRLSQPPPKLSTPKERKWRSVHQTICDEYEARLVGPSSRFIFHQLSVSRYQYQSMYTVLYMYVFQCCSPGNCIINHHTNYII